MQKKNNISTGNCGEYFVAAELERRGFSVAVPMSNTEAFDILAVNRQTLKEFVIQVKTTTMKWNKWRLTAKSENLRGDNIFYVFVKLNGLEMPEYHVVNSNVVADHITNGHRNWLNTPGRNGAVHKDNNIRNFADWENAYLDRWGDIK